MAQAMVDAPAGTVTQAGEEMAASGYLAEGRVWVTTRRLLFQAWPSEEHGYVQTYAVAHVEEVGMLRYRDPGQVSNGRALLWLGGAAVVIAGGVYEEAKLTAHALAPALRAPVMIAAILGLAAIVAGIVLLVTAWRWCLRVGLVSGASLELAPHPSAKDTPAEIARALSNLLGQGQGH